MFGRLRSNPLPPAEETQRELVLKWVQEVARPLINMAAYLPHMGTAEIGKTEEERFEEVLTQVLEKVARCCKEHGFCLSEPLRDETKKTIAQKWETKPML